MANDSGKLADSQGEWSEAQQGASDAAATDDQLDNGRQDRSYDPSKSAPKGSVSEKLNADSAKYKKGPGPL